MVGCAKRYETLDALKLDLCHFVWDHFGGSSLSASDVSLGWIFPGTNIKFPTLMHPLGG